MVQRKKERNVNLRSEVYKILTGDKPTYYEHVLFGGWQETDIKQGNLWSDVKSNADFLLDRGAKYPNDLISIIEPAAIITMAGVAAAELGVFFAGVEVFGLRNTVIMYTHGVLNYNLSHYKSITQNSNNVGIRIDNINDIASYGKNLGRNGQLFLTNKDALKGLDLTKTSDLAKVEKILGLESGRLTKSQGVVLTTVDLTNKNVRLPSSGNEFFIPGGYTSGGAPEIVIDPLNVYKDSGVSMQFYFKR